VGFKLVVQGRMARLTLRSPGADGAANTADDYVLTADLEEVSAKNWVMQAVNIAEPASANPASADPASADPAGANPAGGGTGGPS
jgi:hypothetical protein